MLTTPRGPVDHVETLVIGAGFGGLAMVDRLLREERDPDVLVVEAADSVGGTWRDNTYPGCACDVPTQLYSLSRHPYPGWSHDFGRQPEIRDYLERVADEIGVRERLVTGCAVTGARWDADRARWDVETTGGALTATYVVVATGALSAPSIPELPGLEDFAGEIFHSARWRHDVPLEGRRIVVVGTGASAVQFVPEIAPAAAHVAVFQRTPGWVLPRLDKPIPRAVRELFARRPVLQKALRARIYAMREFYVVLFTRARFLLPVVELVARAYLFSQIRDRRTRRALTPDFSIGCKRILLTGRWFPALARENVTLVPHAARGLTRAGVVDTEGVEHPADVVVFGTGFTASEPPIARAVSGVDGRTLSEVWDGSPRAHLGVTVAGFPNLFLLYGPNTNLGHSSIVYMLESQADHVVRLQRLARRGARRTVEVTAEAQRRFVERMDAMLADTVWNAGGCSSWYFDRTGRNSLQWPTFTFRYRRETRAVDPADYRVT